MTTGEIAPARLLRVAPTLRRGRAYGRWWLLGACTAIWAAAHAVMTLRADEVMVAAGGESALTPPRFAAPALALATWVVVVVVAGEAGRAVGPRAGRASGAAVLAAAVVLNQIPDAVQPWWYPDLAPRPLAGTAWVPTDPPLLVAWRVAWLALDLALVLLWAGRLRWPARLERDRASAHRTAPAHAAAAASVQGVAVSAIAYAGSLTMDPAASLAGALAFLRQGSVVLGLAVAAGLAAGRRRGLPAALLLAVTLDAAGSAIRPGGDPYGGNDAVPWRLAGPGPFSEDSFASFSTLLLRTLALTAMVAVAAAGGPLARAFSRLEVRPVRALVLGLVLNTVDAAATWAGIRAGTVEEGNPLVREVGLGGKWLIVSVLLLLLWRLRPRLLWLAVAAYALVVAYHLLGATVLA